MISDHKDGRDIVVRGELFSLMASLVMKLIDLDDKDMKTLELLRGNDPIVVNPFQKRPMDESSRIPYFHSKMQILGCKARGKDDASSP